MGAAGRAGALLGRAHLIGTWDLVSARHSDGRLRADAPEQVGLMTCAADGTFTLQMRWSDGRALSTWGHFQWMAPHRLVHVIEWDADVERVGRSMCFEVERADATRLVLMTETGTRFEFER